MHKRIRSKYFQAVAGKNDWQVDFRPGYRVCDGQRRGPHPGPEDTLPRDGEDPGRLRPGLRLLHSAHRERQGA